MGGPTSNLLRRRTGAPVPVCYRLSQRDRLRSTCAASPSTRFVRQSESWRLWLTFCIWGDWVEACLGSSYLLVRPRGDHLLVPTNFGWPLRSGRRGWPNAIAERLVLWRLDAPCRSRERPAAVRSPRAGDVLIVRWLDS